MRPLAAAGEVADAPRSRDRQAVSRRHITEPIVTSSVTESRRPGVPSRYAFRRGVPMRIEPGRRAVDVAARPAGSVGPTVELVPVAFGSATIVVEHTSMGATLHITDDGMALRLDGDRAEIRWFGQMLDANSTTPP